MFDNSGFSSAVKKKFSCDFKSVVGEKKPKKARVGGGSSFGSKARGLH